VLELAATGEPRGGVTLVHEYSDQTVGMDLKMGDWTVPLPTHNYVWALVNYHPPKQVACNWRISSA